MRLPLLVAAAVVLNSPTLPQPWPWPTASQNSVHEINNNYGAYQEFSGAPYCHDGVDIPMSPGDSICAVAAGCIVDIVGAVEDRYWEMAYCTAIVRNWPDSMRAQLDGGPNHRRFYVLQDVPLSMDYRFAFAHYEPWSLNPDIARAQLSPGGLASYTHGAHEKLAEVVEWVNDNHHLHYSVYKNPLERQHENPVKYLSPDPALPSCGIQFDPNPDRAITFRYAEDEGDSAGVYFPLIVVPEGGDDVEYALLWGNADVVSRCWDRYQLTEEQWKLAPYQVGISIEAENPETGEMEIVIPYSPLVVFDGPVADNPAAFWGERAQVGASTPLSREYSNVVYEDDATNNSDGGPPEAPELSFILTNQNGSLDSEGRPVVELADSAYYWDTNGKTGDAWNDNDETPAHEAASEVEALFPDQGYAVMCTAKDHQGRQATYTRQVLVDNFAPYVAHIKARFEREGTREDVVVYEAEWVNGTLDVLTREPGRPIQGDILWCEVWWSEAMRDEGIEAKLVREGPAGGMDECPLTQFSLESDEFENDHWTGRVPQVTWDSLRNLLAGKLWISVEAYDKAGHGLDCAPSTTAKRIDREGGWSGYEDAEGNPTTAGDVDRKNHWFMLTPWRDVLLHMDVSASVTYTGVGGAGWASSAYHMADSLLARMKQDHTDSGRADTWRAGVFRYFGHTVGNSWAVELLQDLSPNIEASRTALTYFVSPPGTPCSSQGEPLDSVVTYLEEPANHSMPRHVVMFTDGEMNRGVSKAEQEELWVEAATDSTYGCGTYLYAIMPGAKANLSDGMCEAVCRSGGRYLTIPEGDMIARYPGGVLYEDLVHTCRIYEAQEESVVTRSTHWFRVDGLSGSLFLLGSWADWGLQLAQGELSCGGLPKEGGKGCGECDGDTAQTGADEGGEAVEGGALHRAASTDIGQGSVGEKSRAATSGERRVPAMVPRREEEAAKAPPPRMSMTLYDEDGVVVPPTGTIGTTIAYWVLSPTVADTGMWRVDVSGGSGPYDLRVSERGGVRIELAGSRLAGVNMGCGVKVRVESEWFVQSPSWELLDSDGGVVAGLSLYDDGLHGDGLAGDGVYAGTLGSIAEPGFYRVRMRSVVNGMRIERVTGEGLWVTRPEFVFLTPSAGIDTVEASYLITWADTSEFAAEIALYYDTDSFGADGLLITGGIEEDKEGSYDQYLWNAMTVPEGRYWVYAVIADGIGSPRTIYSDGSIVLEREYHPGWPVPVGGLIRAPVTLADLDGDGGVETIVGAGDSLLYVLAHDGTARAGFPFACAGAITAGVAVGDVDGDGSKELVAVTGDYWGPAYVWVLDDEANVEAGWPVTIAQGTRSTPLLVNLVGAASSPPEIVVAGYDSLVQAWTGDGSVVAGWPRKLSGPIQDSSPVGGDIDWDGENEVVVARAAAWPTGVITAVETNGTVKWEKATPSFIYSAPALWDVDNDRKPELIVATSNPAATGWVYVLNGENGSDAAGWTGGKNIGQGSWASPAVGYLTLTDEPRIVVANGQGEVRAYSRTGVLVWTEDVTGSSPRTSPVIADIDGDMATEVLLAVNGRLCVLEGADGDTMSAYNKPLGTYTQSTVAVADLDGNGDLEVVAADSTVIRCWDIEGTEWSDGQEWPQFKRDEGKAGRYRENVDPEAPEIAGIEVVTPDSLRIRWEAVRVDTYGRPEWVRRYRVYRGAAPYAGTWGTQVGLVNAPDTVYVERPGTVNDPNVSSYYRVRAEDLYGNQSALSDETVGEFERDTGSAAKKPPHSGQEGR